ncbi:unnamed protein product [Caenorhabditis auriculariae]|uniref:Ubiquitin carboxyl-terminal hydrolase n=1 Tax=Caenorhabditis auriculariae TaxID=2777116 RepID=A0A8S1HCK5_9PELO|nr:unnamed protein product [Caenorhabditis auriculariae]
MDEYGTREESPDHEMGEPLTHQELRELISIVENEPLENDATWFVISQAYWEKLIKAANDGYVEDVGEIDNSSISELGKGGYFLKKGLSEAVDYQTVPERVFQRLNDAYGMANDKCDYIPRKVVQKDTRLVIEIYPRIVNISLARNRNIVVALRLKASDKMVDLRRRAMEELSVTEKDKPKFYIMNNEVPELIDTTQEVNSYFDTAQKVVVDTLENGEYFIRGKKEKKSPPPRIRRKELESEEEEGESSKSSSGDGSPDMSYNDGIGGRLAAPFFLFWHKFRLLWWQFSLMWPQALRDFVRFLFGWWILRPPSRSLIGSSSFGLPFSSTIGEPDQVPPGMTGLTNLGNTCFMASALQCMSNMPPLRDFFVSNKYEQDLNRENPLGTHGELAEAFGHLVKHIWSGNYRSVVPRRVKNVIGAFAPRFSGYAQQDAQELLAYVLDGLHEDLNRIKKKPYIEDNDEWSKLPDNELAEKSWEMYKMRNDSIIVDTLHGQLKSTLVCPVCEKVSIKFDPFGCLSLPLPPKDVHVKQTVTVVFFGRKWAKFMFTVTKKTTIEDAERLIAAKLQLEKKFSLVFFQIAASNSMNILNDEVTLLRPTDSVFQGGREVYAVEMEHDPSETNTKLLVVYNRSKIARPCSLPLIFAIPNGELTKEWIVDVPLKMIKRLYFHNAEALDGVNDENHGEDREMYTIQLNDKKLDGRGDSYSDVKTCTFLWKDAKLFNNNRGMDLVEREVTVPLRRKIHLMETLEWFTTMEQLGEDDLWYCPNCKKHQRATKKLDLWKLPEILVMHLKRFTYSRWSREKLNWEVITPVTALDLTSKVANPNHDKAIYDLIGMSCHYGVLSSGHYTAAAINDLTGQWVDFNDSHASVRQPPSDPMEAAEPYMLVYRRRPLGPDGEPTEVPLGHMKTLYRPVNVPMVHDENVEMEQDDEYDY